MAAPTAGPTPPLRQRIAIVRPAISWAPLSAADKARVLESGIVGLDVCLDAKGAEACVRDAQAAGLEVRGHAWTGRAGANGVASVSAALGREHGDRWGRELLRLALVGFGDNAEVDVWQGSPKGVKPPRAHPQANAYLAAFGDAFQQRVAGAGALNYLGFAAPWWHYPKAHIAADVKASRQRVLVMAYQDSYAGIVGSLARARSEWPDHPLEAFASIGVLRPDGSVIGDAAAWERIARERVVGLSGITWYIGVPPSWARQLLHGNPKHPSVVDMVARIAATASSEAA